MFGQVKDAWIAISLIITGLGLAHAARSAQVWHRLAGASRGHRFSDEQSKKILRGGLREPFSYFFLVLFAVAGLGLFGGAPGIPLLAEINFTVHNGSPEYSAVQLGIAGSALLVAFVPLATLVFLEARRCAPAPLLRDDSISMGGFYIPLVAIVLISVLAVWAARASMAASGEDGATGITENLAFFITLIVIAVFVVFILMPHVQRLADNWHDRAAAQRPTGTVAPNGPAITWKTLPEFASRVDSFLVRFVAPLSGVTQPGRGIPHLFVICMLVPMTALGFLLPPPLGLLPIGLGILIVLALGRRWAWVEEDRDTASRLLQTRSPEIHVGFGNDLKDEALLGYASLFLLVPLALYQINEIIPAFAMRETGDATNAFYAWVSFFGAELAKAVPFVDWWEIYDVRIDVPVERVCSSTEAACPPEALERGLADAGKHLTFAARAIVDLVIMAALFQAIGIWQRSRAQEALYDAGQLDAFDPFLEEAFFRRGMRRTGHGWVPTAKFEKRVETHIAKRTGHGLPLAPYNERRLTELLEHPDEEILEGVDWMTEKYPILVGKPSRKLALLRRQWDKAPAEHLANPDNADHPAKATEWRRTEKPRLEAVIAELLGEDREARPKALTDDDVRNLLGLLAVCGHYPEFLYARLEIVALLSQAAGERAPSAIWALVAHVCPNKPAYMRWLDRIVRETGGAVHYGTNVKSPVYLGWEEHRKPVYDAIEELAFSYSDPNDTLRDVAEFLGVRSTDEAKQKARPAAKKAFDALSGMVGAGLAVQAAKASDSEGEESDED
ncbi:hypothetical protein [Hyphomonas sp.]|uniref:hypothetical protein n=1 Tax=Hyphomonas sp. TaxID=87 RepID=UPI0039196094